MIRIFFVLCFSICFAISLKAQNIDLNQKISLSKQTSLESILKQISEEYHIHFSYSKSQIPTEQTITIKATNKPLSEVLDQLCLEAGMSYSIVEGQVVLRHANNNPQIHKTEKETHFTVAGFVRDSLTGEALIGVPILIKESGQGTQTNAYGYYSITLPAGSYNLIYSFISYRSQVLNIYLSSNKLKNIALSIKEHPIHEISVSSSAGRLVKANQIGWYNLNLQNNNPTVGFMGEGDALKTIYQVPGVKPFADGSVMFHVRGGERDQNLILLDDAPIFNPSHLLGIFSSLVTDALKTVDLYKGDMPANLGGRLSSVMDVRTKDGNMKQFALSGSTGIVASRISVEAPIVKDICSFFLSARRSNIDWFAQKFVDPNLSLFFYDLNGKLNWKPNAQNRLYLSFYYGEDQYKSDGKENQWNNGLLSMRWNFIPRSNLFMNLTLHASQYSYKLLTTNLSNNYWANSISNYGAKEDLTDEFSPSNRIKVGLGCQLYSFDPGNYHDQNVANMQFIPYSSSFLGSEFYAYISHELALGEQFSLRYGLRISGWMSHGASTEYLFDQAGNVNDTLHFKKGQAFNKHLIPEPRINLRYAFAQNQSVKLSYSRTTQFIQLISNSVSPFTSLELWLPTTLTIQPQYADQLALAYYQQMENLGLDLSLEAYSKKMYNQIDYVPHPKLLLNPFIEGELRFGQSRAYGIEVLLQKQAGVLELALGYSYSRVFRQINGINNGFEYPAFYDSPEQLSANMGYKFNDRFRFSINWTYNTGQWYTSPTGFYVYNGYTVPTYGTINNSRLPDYHRMDCSLDVDLSSSKQRWKHTLNLTIFNLYNRKNTIYINYNKTTDPDGQLVIDANHLDSDLVGASQLYLYGVVPSLSYRFRF